MEDKDKQENLIETVAEAAEGVNIGNHNIAIQMSIFDSEDGSGNKIADSIWGLSIYNDSKIDPITHNIIVTSPSGVPYFIGNTFANLPTYSTKKLWNFIIKKCFVMPTQEYHFNLREYQEYYGLSTKPTALKKAKAQFIKDLTILAYTIKPLPWKEKIIHRNCPLDETLEKPGRNKGEVIITNLSSIFDEISITDNGYDCTIKLTNSLMRYLGRYPYKTTENHAAYIDIKDNTQVTVYHCLEVYYSKVWTTDFQKKQQDAIRKEQEQRTGGIKTDEGYINLNFTTVLRYSGLPSFEYVRKAGKGNYFNKIIFPLTTALDRLAEQKLISYFIVDAEGNKIGYNPPPETDQEREELLEKETKETEFFQGYKDYKNSKIYYKIINMPARKVKPKGRKAKADKGENATDTAAQGGDE